mgnify:CR=1 FL=1
MFKFILLLSCNNTFEGKEEFHFTNLIIYWKCIRIPVNNLELRELVDMKKALMIASVLFIAVVSTACINNMAVQELNNKAAEYMQKGDYESAMNRLQASLDLDSTMYETYYNLGVAAINANKYEKAIEALEGGIKIKPDYADFYYSLGLAQTSLADEIIENSEKELSEGEKNAEIVNTEPKKELSDEDKAKVADLKKQAAENLTKYLEMNPNGEDKQTVEELIKEINSYSEESSAKVEE